jgi:hypothetical protein
MEGGVIQWTASTHDINVILVDMDAEDDGENPIRGISSPDYISKGKEFGGNQFPYALNIDYDERMKKSLSTLIEKTELHEDKVTYFANLKKAEYIEKVIQDMEKLNLSFKRLNDTWQKEMVFDIDLNNFMTVSFPFEMSFDEQAIAVDEWYHATASKLIGFKRALQPNLADRNNLGEPPAPYFTKAEAEGKWVCAFDTICGGYQCVTTENEKGETIPYLYDSKAEVEADDFFDHQEDFAILATEFVLGRKVIYGKNGGVIEGTPIVKPE